MEMMIGEAERTRSISYGIKAIPRFCDIHCIQQSSKFELAEMDDTRENRTTILNSIIEEAIKEVSSEYLRNLTQEQITKVKNEFIKNKSFQTSQTLPGNGVKTDLDYQSQLAMFPALRQIINDSMLTIKEEQMQLVERAENLGIKSENISISQEIDGEFTASITEVILEGLRYIQPPLLDKKDSSFDLRE
jgi:magnesium chelatase subunit I